jgi:endonuclease/exonuclease/phosphatase family metal-dependent hydrolase
MPRGADDRYWEGPGLSSVFKHTLLQKYMPQFAGMTGSRAQTKRVVVRLGSRRPEQAGVLAALLTHPSREGPLPVFLTGDLNALPTTSEIRSLTEVAVDAWVASSGTGDPGHTLSTNNPLAPRKAWQLDHRIDYILARPGRPAERVEVERSFLAGGPVDGVRPSDHWAVVADFRL